MGFRRTGRIVCTTCCALVRYSNAVSWWLLFGELCFCEVGYDVQLPSLVAGAKLTESEIAVMDSAAAEEE